MFGSMALSAPLFILVGLFATIKAPFLFSLRIVAVIVMVFTAVWFSPLGYPYSTLGRMAFYYLSATSLIILGLYFGRFLSRPKSKTS
jgi:hypothetical protein